MIKFSKLFETVYEPRSGDEKNFKDKHVIMKIKTPYDTESQFTSNKPKAKRKADYDTKDDESVYEAANVHTKRADKEAVIVRAVDPKTGESRARVIQRRAGEIKIGEEVELDEAAEYTMKQLQKKFKDGTHEAMNDPVPGRHVELRNTKTGKRTTHYVKEEWYKDANGKEYPFSKPFDSKSNAHEFAKKNGLSKRDVKSRPAGYVVEKPSVKEEVELDENLGKASKKMKFWFNTDPRDIKARLKNSSPEFQNRIATQTGKLAGPAELQRRLAKRITQKNEEVEQIDELSKDTLHSYMKKSVPDFLKTKKSAEKLKMTPKNAGKIAKAAIKLRNRAAGVNLATKKMSEEVEQIDEISKKTLGSYIKKASQSAVERRAVADRLNRRAFDVDNKDSERYFDASDRAYKKHKNRLAGIAKASDRLAKEEFDLNEAVKVGAMHLHDGSSVTVTREMADVLNNVLEQLNPMNRVKMEEKLHTSKKDFMELLKFAENI